MNTDKKFEFLKFAIEDAQELIRYIDAKTAIAVTIIGAFIVGIFSIIEKIVKYYSNYTFLFWLLFVLFMIFLVVCTRITARIIKPTTNPTNNIEMDGLSVPDIKFYLAPNKYKHKHFHIYWNSDKDKLGYSYKKYLEDISLSDDNKLIEALSFELAKVSFIRNIKNDRFNVLVSLLIVSSLLFAAFYILYNIQTEGIIGKENSQNKEKNVSIYQINNVEKEKGIPKIIYRYKHDTSHGCSCCK